ncbi:hypothetical protein IPC426_19385 [Pseudomonas aeruginosa]|nr:hypothetical protein HV99_26600 [Pseudomonas aeruginosa]KAJ18284.1 hypothetical protein M003_28575 [Pseudomonas aeruginosa IGB83]OXZ17659.1 hypothetical protein ACG90_08800 [Pseudomonas aeruginosa]QEF79305.1 hypothetical protein DBZ62_19210 [Pseudomonas aeruginosa]QEF85308.1 hypothetical protein DBX32_19225 [Pseudomonas aeruginosa]
MDLATPSIFLLLVFYPIPGRLREAAEKSGGDVRRFQGMSSAAVTGIRRITARRLFALRGWVTGTTLLTLPDHPVNP